MTENRRIALNVFATYGRSLYALAVGLCCGRWTYLAMGKVDYGLLGVVGGLIGFVTFFNTLMSGSVSRFYAYSVGEARKEGNAVAGLETCRRWFSIAVALHTLIPVVLMAIGYPLGEWAVRHFLTIPPDRVGACVWVWRFTSLSCFVGMVSVPFSAMYNAKQEIAELTVYGFATATLNALFGYYMITHSGEWIVKYAAWMCVMSVLPQLIICTRALIVYPECRFRSAYVRDWPRIGQLFAYAGSRFVVLLSLMLSTNGIGILVNKCLGPLRNAAMSVSGSVTGQCQSLASSLSGAFSPAITNAAGAGDLARMRKLAYATCRLSTVAVGIFALPMALEADEVLRLWLKTPPDWAGALVVCALVCAVLDKLSEGCWISIFAIGRTALFNASEAAVWFLMLPLAYAFIRGGFDVVGVGITYIVLNACAVLVKLYFGRRIAGLSVRHWIRRVFVPIAVAFTCAAGGGVLSVLSAAPGVFRIVQTAAVAEAILLPLVWFMVLQDSERKMMTAKISRLIGGRI